MSAEWMLALLIVALYLKDSLLLLRPDEAVLVRGAGGRWRAGFGAQDFKLRGREPYLANPLLPHEPVYRLRWHMDAPAGVDAGAPEFAPEAAAILARFGAGVWWPWAMIFVAIPFTVIARLGVWSTLTAVVLLYAGIVALLAGVWRRRAELGLGGRGFALLAFECLACAPYAANLVRRLAWARPPSADFTLAAARVLSARQLADAHAACRARIDEELEAAAEGSPAAQALQESRRRFETAAAAAPDAGGDT